MKGMKYLTVGFKSKIHILPDRITFRIESIFVPYRWSSYSPHSTNFPSSISRCISDLDMKKYPLPFSSPDFLGLLVSKTKNKELIFYGFIEHCRNFFNHHAKSLSLAVAPPKAASLSILPMIIHIWILNSWYCITEFGFKSWIIDLELEWFLSILEVQNSH